MLTTPQRKIAQEQNAFESREQQSFAVEPCFLLFVFSVSGDTSVFKYWISSGSILCTSFLFKEKKNVSEQTVIYFQNHSKTSGVETIPLKSPDVYLFVMDTAPLTTSVADWTANNYEQKKRNRKIMQVSHRACQQFFLAEGELSKLPFELNPFHSYLIFKFPPAQINSCITPTDISTKPQSCGSF